MLPSAMPSASLCSCHSVRNGNVSRRQRLESLVLRPVLRTASCPASMAGPIAVRPSLARGNALFLRAIWSKELDTDCHRAVRAAQAYPDGEHHTVAWALRDTVCPPDRMSGPFWHVS